MALTQAEAVSTLVMEMGYADGDYSDEEMCAILKEYLLFLLLFYYFGFVVIDLLG